MQKTLKFAKINGKIEKERNYDRRSNMAHQMIMVIDFGGQYNQLIARRVRECSVYCEIFPYQKVTKEVIETLHPQGIIFTGGPNSVYGEGAPRIFADVFQMGIPVLGFIMAVS